MSTKKAFVGVVLGIFVALSLPVFSFAQEAGTLRGKVTLDTNGQPIHGVIVTVLRLNRSAITDDDGVYEIPDIPPGSYSVSAHLDGVPDVVQMMQISGAATLDFQMRLRGTTVQVTVTATGEEESTFNSIQAVNIVPSAQILQAELWAGRSSTGYPGVRR
jgi:hypothetical protein